MVLLIIAPLLVGGGTYLLATSRQTRRPTLSERLKPYHARRVGDEAEEWLNRQ